MSECHDYEKCYCWNGCEDLLKEKIERNSFYKKIRQQLTRRKLKYNRYNQDNHQ
ncbi:MAG: hypothetical protein ACFFAS_13740 [Promethearchaeota archaeon]